MIDALHWSNPEICGQSSSRSSKFQRRFSLFISESSDSHYNDVTMNKIASQITSLTIVYSTVYSGPDQTKHQSSASLAFFAGNAQMASNAENVSIWWRHHGFLAVYRQSCSCHFSVFCLDVSWVGERVLLHPTVFVNWYLPCYCDPLHDDVIKWRYFPRYWPVPDEYPAQRPVTRSFDVFLDLSE